MRPAKLTGIVPRLRTSLAGLALAATLYSGAAMATVVTRLTFDAANDKLIMHVAYRGTHPNHQFSVEWSECRPLEGERSEILGVLVDSAGTDLAREEFTATVEIDMSAFQCRPAQVTIRTSAGFFNSVDIPAAAKTTRRSE